MKPVAEHYRFLTVRHQDSLWKRHRFEAKKTTATNDARPATADLLLEQRKEHWLMQCRFVLERLLIPLCRGDTFKKHRLANEL